jgi:DNA repair protein RadC
MKDTNITKHISIKDWAEDDQPREKLVNKGKQALSDAELLAILLGSGTVSMSAVELAKQILQGAGNNLHELAKMSVKELQKFKGIGEAKAITIVSALELGRRRKEAEPVKRDKITCSQDVYEIMKPYLLDLPHEEFWVMFLNRANVVIKTEKMSSGGVTGTVADPKIIFKRALEEMANGLILVHNHPSGNTQPSRADIELTQKMREGAKLLDMQVLDHLIFTDHHFYSFADEGI